jgi:hypothetical protein
MTVERDCTSRGSIKFSDKVQRCVVATPLPIYGRSNAIVWVVLVQGEISRQ